MGRGASMKNSHAKQGVSQLCFKRNWLSTQLECRELLSDESRVVIADIEDLDLRIAATACDTVQDLCLKLERLATLLHPSEDAIEEDCLEHIMLAALIRDARAFNDLP